MADAKVSAIILGSLDTGSIQLSKGDLRRLKDLRLLLTKLEGQAQQSVPG
ncbi:MAG: hypothetical protein HN763_12795 [Opitutales bacterium]|nr:hypothetical protein [Opitutales bacterium]MBT6379623.1 hypothetical protein [Opitutales bacterium]MBT7867219.1 hypothetical protein [Opitutales bacterium]